jgi:hypothetical protein
MFSTRNGVMNLFDPVGREEHDPLIRLEFSLEHRNKGITVDVMEGALLQGYISFIEKEDGVLNIRSLKYQGQLRFKLLYRCA